MAIASSVVLALLLGLVVVSLAPASARDRLRSLSGASFRLDTWRDSLRLAATSPLVGHGLGAFHDAYPRFKRGHESVRVEHAENDYLETLAETGLAGLVTALVALVLLFRAGAGRALGDRSAVVLGAGRGGLAALAALAVHSAFDFDLRIPSNAALAALVRRHGGRLRRTHVRVRSDAVQQRRSPWVPVSCWPACWRCRNARGGPRARKCAVRSRHRRGRCERCASDAPRRRSSRCCASGRPTPSPG